MRSRTNIAPKHEPEVQARLAEKATTPKLELNACQTTAKEEILKACKPTGRHLLTGWAGTGKTYLLSAVARELVDQEKKVVLTAPTHKAVAVLAAKAKASGLDVPCITIHSLLSLEPKPGPNGALRLQRRKGAKLVDADVIVIDETSMVDRQLYAHIKRHLAYCFVLFVGDPAQIPPVGETESVTFGTKSRSHLETIVRQEADNPVLAAATIIRESQGHDVDWSWCKPAFVRPKGVYLPGKAVDLWLQRAFKSEEFAKDNDTFRYLCWTNDRVARVNSKIRKWLYGETLFPFAPGERALIRAPIIQDKVVIFNTNEEARVESVEPATYTHRFEDRDNLDEWSVGIPTWEIVLSKGGVEAHVHMPREHRLVSEVTDRIVSEARIDRRRWIDLYEFKDALATLQSVYALTVHTAQGSTFGSVFLDVADIRRREKTNPLEMQQLLYVGATRPSKTLILVGV